LPHTTPDSRVRGDDEWGQCSVTHLRKAQNSSTHAREEEARSTSKEREQTDVPWPDFSPFATKETHFANLF
jgi:hypothetical protein